MSPNALPARVVAHLAGRAAYQKAIDNCFGSRLEHELAAQFNPDTGLVADYQTIEGALASDGNRQLLDRLGIPASDFIRRVEVRVALKQSLPDVQKGRLAAARAQREKHGMDPAAVDWLAKRLAKSRSATGDYEVALADEEAVRGEVSTYPRTAAVLDRLHEAERNSHDAFTAMLQARRECLAAINQFLDPAATDDWSDDEIAAVSEAEPIADWRHAVGVEHISGH